VATLKRHSKRKFDRQQEVLKQMDIQKFEHSDINFISDLIPIGWEGAIPTIDSYTNTNFCFPIKVSIDKTIVGIGTTIIHDGTAWLAHIIVHPDFRNQRIGKIITQTLVDNSYSKGCDTIYLLATELGEPVYKKIGFETETEYIVFKKEGTNESFENPENIIAFNNDFKNQILNLDRQVSGEDRIKLLDQHLSDGFLYLQDNKTQGFYLPNLGDGLIIATTNSAGQELMKLRLKSKDFASFPIDNSSATEFMRQNNLNEIRIQKRMRLGKKRNWQPRSIYNRIGGNLG
jgi:N-acetylglutamate synthase-like GNAT family acetyltransferase